MATGSDAAALQRVAQDRPAKVRDIRLDVFRGLALLLIAVTHMGGNWLVELMPSHFGFSSSTEMFVFCSGVASGLAFGSLFVKRGFWLGTLRVAYRIWEIYWAHLATFVAVLALSVALAAWLDKPGLLALLQLDVFLDDPRRGLLALVSLTYLPPLFDILPLYIVLLAMIPVVMAARLLSKTLPFILVGAVYLYLWTAGFQLPGSPADPSRGWLFNPLGWQLVFFAGFFIAMKWVDIPAPGTPWAVAAALTVVLVSLPLCWHVLYQNVDLLGYLREKILPGSERSNFHILRFVHFLALAYLAVSVVALYPRLVATTPARVLAATGRETLAAFLASIPIAIIGGSVLDRYGTSPALVIAATLLSWAAIIGVAYLAAYVKSKPWTAPRAPRPAEARLPVLAQASAQLAPASVPAGKIAVAG